MSIGGDAEAQIVFESITPKSNVNVRNNIEPKGIHMEPPEQMMAPPSEPSASMTLPKQHVITPPPIIMSPISRTNIRPKTIQMNQPTFNPMVKDNITPQQIRTAPMDYTLAPVPINETSPPLQPVPHWAFNPAMEGTPPPDTIPYNTSIRTDDMPPARAGLHPMAW